MPCARGRLTGAEESLAFAERLAAGREAVREIVGKVWPYVVVGIARRGRHPWLRAGEPAGRDHGPGGLVVGARWPCLIGVPMYSNAAGVIPVVQALLEKGAALGTVLAFMMSVVGLSLPEVVILRKVLKPPLIVAFVGTVALGILAVGYLFNLVL